MYLFRVTFDRHMEEKIIESQEFICAEEFSDVYEKVKIQQDENYELVEIKRMVPVIGVIESKKTEEDTED